MRVRGRHQFTDPTPVSFRGGGTVVPARVASWEIECCAPPPTVGQTATWRLGFHPGGGEMDPLLDFEHDWIVTSWPVPSYPSALCLTDGLIQACWRQPPANQGLGRIRLRGQVFATKHGGDGWEMFPRTTTRVLRVQVVTTDVRWSTGQGGRGRRGVPVQGSTLLADVMQSPRQFPQEQLRDFIGDEPVAGGVLIDLATWPQAQPAEM